jgi:hypothetical protein
MFRNVLLTHEPANAVVKSDGHRPYDSYEWGLPEGAALNIHGHLHNIWDGFHNAERIARDKELLGVDFTKRLKHPWQRLFAVEYTDYRPVEFNKFVAKPDCFQARGPKKLQPNASRVAEVLTSQPMPGFDTESDFDTNGNPNPFLEKKCVCTSVSIVDEFCPNSDAWHRAWWAGR